MKLLVALIDDPGEKTSTKSAAEKASIPGVLLLLAGGYKANLLGLTTSNHRVSDDQRTDHSHRFHVARR